MDVLSRHAGVGLWSAELHQGDPMHPDSKWTWSEEFRRLLGFDHGDLTGFPDVVGSWADRLHPDDAPGIFKKFGACLADRTGATNYDVEYRLKCKNGDYRWFRAVGGVARDESGCAARACGALIDVDDLAQLILKTQSAANEIISQSSQLANGNADLSRRTAEQSASLEDTAVSMEKMTGIVKLSAVNARKANTLAAQTRDIAEKGGVIVNDAIRSMQAIYGSSKQINDIITVIDEIAFQTNLLALNAAVEAARVGEQGKGFAVVASEVRSLAGRSATAAKEIKELVQDSVRKVEEGTGLVNSSGAQLADILTAVKNVAKIVGEISSASEEQSAGIDQVNKAVISLDAITHQNAALVDEATGASQAMAQQAFELRQVVGNFKMSHAQLDTSASQSKAA